LGSGPNFGPGVHLSDASGQIPGPVDEALLLLVAPVFLILYRDPMRDAWARAMR
jgi:hypothetical protein